MARGVDRERHGAQTLAIHAGETPDPATGASSPNIVMSSTFVTERPEGFSAHELSDDSPFVYSRWANPTVRALEAKLAALEGSEDAICFASGMAAAAAILLSRLSAGDHLVLSDVCYAGIAELGRDTLPRLGVSVTAVDCSEPEAIEAAMRPETKLVFVDTPANPIMRLTDIARAAEIAHAGGALLVVDSTFATPIGTRPIALGADFVMHSATKYLNGHGDALGGAVCCSKELAQALRVESIVHYGGVMSPMSAWLISRGISTLPLRMRAHEETSLALGRALEAHPAVEAVLYPGLPSHPQHALAARQMACFSGMMTFRVKGGAMAGAALAEKMARADGGGLDIAHYAVSLGHARTLICWMPTASLLQTSFRLSGAAENAYRAYAGDGVFRLSVGLEDAEDLIRDFEKVLG